MLNKQQLMGLLSGTVLAVALSLFFRYPLLPVLLCIALAARMGKSADWRAGLAYGSVIGVAGFFLRITTQTPVLSPTDLTLALVSAAVIWGVVGIGIARLFGSGDTIMW